MATDKQKLKTESRPEESLKCQHAMEMSELNYPPPPPKRLHGVHTVLIVKQWTAGQNMNLIAINDPALLFKFLLL